jgi:predicted esterase
MAFRAAAHAAGCEGIVALGGEIPPEIRAAQTRLPSVLVGRGLRDELYTAEKFAADVAWLRATGVDAVTCEFDGGHEWTDAFCAAASVCLTRLAVGGDPGSR